MAKVGLLLVAVVVVASVEVAVVAVSSFEIAVEIPDLVATVVAGVAAVLLPALMAADPVVVVALSVVRVVALSLSCLLYTSPRPRD